VLQLSYSGLRICNVDRWTPLPWVSLAQSLPPTTSYHLVVGWNNSYWGTPPN